MVHHLLLSVQIFDLIDPILNLLHFVESEYHLVDFILYPEVIWLLFIQLFLIFLQLGSFYVVIGSLFFIIFIQIKINVMIGHDCHILLPYFSQTVFNVYKTNLWSLCLDLFLLIYTSRHSLFVLLLFKLKGIPYSKKILIWEFIQIEI